MQYPITPINHPIDVELHLPGAKSITNRAIILAALADGVSELTNMYLDENIHTFIQALYQLGIVTQLDETAKSCIIAGGNGSFPRKQARIWCGNNALIARYLIAATSATPGVYYFDGTPQLRAKPILQLLNILRMQGVQFIPSDVRKLPFTMIGSNSLEGGEIAIEGAILSQIISAVLMIAPFARSPFNFSLEENTAQHAIEMTCMLMAEFGVLSHRIHQGQYMVPTPQRYQARDYIIEPDFSLAMYFYAAAALTGGKVTIREIKASQSKQAASKFLSTLEKMGCKIIENSLGTTVKGPAELQGIEVKLNEFADNFLVLAAIAPFAKTPSRIVHDGPLRKQESDRFIAIKTELIKLGVQLDYDEHCLQIYPSRPSGGLTHGHQNAKVAMALALIGLRTPGIVIEHAQTITKVFPDFFKYWQKLAEKTPATV